MYYREAYGLKISNGILFNESEREERTFVTRKITLASTIFECLEHGT
jgi:GDP-D-mannose dehydratase